MAENEVETEVEIVQKGPYKGWAVGRYLRWPGTKDLMTKAEEEEFYAQEKLFLEKIKADTNKPASNSFKGVDGMVHQLPISFVGVMETEQPVVEAAKRFHDGHASWDELVFFVVRYDFYTPVQKDSVVIDKNGNKYLTEDSWTMGKRTPEDIQTANNKKFITNEEQMALYKAMDEFESSIPVSFKGMPYGTRP